MIYRFLIQSIGRHYSSSQSINKSLAESGHFFILFTQTIAMRLFRLFLIVLIFCGACRSGDIACPDPQSVRLKKHAGVNYRVLLARRRMEPKKITKAQLRQLQAKEYKTVPVEEWDCPRPGMNKMPRHVQDNIRRNKKRINEYYKNRESADSLSLTTPKK